MRTLKQTAVTEQTIDTGNLLKLAHVHVKCISLHIIDLVIKFNNYECIHAFFFLLKGSAVLHFLAIYAQLTTQAQSLQFLRDRVAQQR